MKNQKGQSTVEYVVLIIVVIGVFIAMQSYFKRGLQGRWKSALDDFGEQYDPQVMNSDVTYRLTSNVETRLRFVDAAGGKWTMRTDVSNSVDSKTGYSRVSGY